MKERPKRKEIEPHSWTVNLLQLIPENPKATADMFSRMVKRPDVRHALMRLEKLGLVVSELGGNRRGTVLMRTFKLTPAGEAKLAELLERRKQIKDLVQQYESEYPKPLEIVKKTHAWFVPILPSSWYVDFMIAIKQNPNLSLTRLTDMCDKSPRSGAYALNKLTDLGYATANKISGSNGMKFQIRLTESGLDFLRQLIALRDAKK